MSYYLYSAELPSALLRGKFIVPFPTRLPSPASPFSSSQLISHSQDWPRNFLHQLDHGYRYLVRLFQFLIPGLETRANLSQLCHSPHAPCT